eukprot:NODE_307_length_2265_cov_155.196751_g239_i0.p1 GENE.NODE_307_length_2265_cov_155.196751_g239_i0~~NODE_307_length_2265_cov_155.196751_g239_i0.p1  ORF type:complete len:624 (-),score=246.36 NODE_307_length_2265_cov_155.196751_g239_i0:394-2241(-)
MGAPEMPVEQGAERAPLYVSAVIDKSGSMSGPKLELVKKTLGFVTQQLQAKDRMGLVTFDSNVSEEFPLTNMDAAGVLTATQKVKDLNAGSCTNLSGGLFKGLEQITGVHIEGINQGGPPSATPPRKASPSRRKSGSGIMNFLQQGISKLGLAGSSSSGHSAAPGPGPNTTTTEFSVKVGSDRTAEPQTWKVYLEPKTPELATLIASVQVEVDFCDQSGATLSSPPFELSGTGPASTGQAKFTINWKTELVASGPTEVLLAMNPEYDNISTTKPIEVLVIVPETSTPERKKSTDEGAPANAPSTEKGPVHCVWLFTDGQANEGIVSQDGIREVMKKYLGKSAHPVQIHTFGFGSDHAPDLLKGLAGEGNGMYYFIDSEDTIPQAFGECLGGLLSVVCQNTELAGSVTAAELSKVQTHYPHELTEKTSFSVSMRDLFSEEQRDVMLCLKLPKGSSEVVVEATLKAFNVVSGAFDSVPVRAVIKRPDSVPADTAPCPKAIETQRNRMRCTAALEKARELGRESKLDEARSVLNAAKDEVKASATANEPYCKNLLQDLDLCLAGLQDQLSWRTDGEKMMTQCSTEHALQRGGTGWVSKGRAAPYSSKAKAAVSSSFQP